MTNNITYHRISPDKFPDVIQQFRRSFFGDEPLNKSLALCKPGEPHAELEEYSLNVMSQGLSTMAQSGPNEEVVGAILMGCPANDTSQKKEYKDPKLQTIFKFIGDSLKQVDFGNDLKLEDFADLKIISVDDCMRGKGIARELYKQSEDIARELGFKMMRADATALFTQKILEKYGWETIKEIKYSEYPSTENPLFKTEPPHDSLKLMIKRLE